MEKNKLKTFLLAYTPVVLWALLIFILSSQKVLPSLEISTLDFLFKKSAHIFVYAVLYYLLVRAMLKTEFKAIDSKFLLILPILICLLYSVSDELHQSFVPGRYPTIRDIIYDMLGVGLAFLKVYNYI